MIENDSIPLSARAKKVAINGRKRYDRHAKRELVQACLQPGVSVAAMALRNGINANLLRKWIRLHKQSAAPSVATNLDFVPVMISTPELAVPPAAAARVLTKNVRARLSNGVQVDLGHVDAKGLAEVLSVLSALPCSGSTRS